MALSAAESLVPRLQQQLQEAAVEAAAARLEAAAASQEAATARQEAHASAEERRALLCDSTKAKAAGVVAGSGATFRRMPPRLH